MQLDVDRMSLFKCHLTAFWNSSQKFIPNLGRKNNANCRVKRPTLGEDIKIVTIKSQLSSYQNPLEVVAGTEVGH